MSFARLYAIAEHATIVPLTLDQYARMNECGILLSGAPIELLAGVLVHKDRSKAGDDPKTVGVAHSWTVQNLRRVLSDPAETVGCHVALQAPFAIPPDGAPEPDGALVRGTIDDYLRHYPFVADIRCVIEVSDASLAFDRMTKRRIYAAAGVPQYVIINLVDFTLEVFDEPFVPDARFVRQSVLHAGDVVRLSVDEGRSIDVEVSRLLPPP
jgi:Uma2 family endonuclease